MSDPKNEGGATRCASHEEVIKAIAALPELAHGQAVLFEKVEKILDQTFGKDGYETRITRLETKVGSAGRVFWTLLPTGTVALIGIVLMALVGWHYQQEAAVHQDEVKKAVIAAIQQENQAGSGIVHPAVTQKGP